MAQVEIFNLPDAVDEDVESLQIHIGIPSNASLSTDQLFLVDLLDDDPEPVVFISSTPQLLDEQDITLPISVGLTRSIRERRLRQSWICRDRDPRFRFSD